MIICLDDFERKGKDLPVDEVLGFITFLKEEKNCKIILILNEDTLNENDSHSFHNFIEKSADIKLHFSPTAQEASAIIFDGTHPSYQTLNKACIELNITNLRVLGKINYMALQFYKIIDIKINTETMDVILRTLSLLYHALYLEGDNKKLYNYLIKPGIKDHTYAEAEEDKIIAQEYDSILKKYRYTYTDEIDLIVVSAIENGYIDYNRLSLEISKQGDSRKRHEAIDELHASWRPFHTSFNDNANEITTTMLMAIKKNAGYINVTQLDQMVSFTRSLGKEDVANEMIDSFIDNNENDIDALNIDEITIHRPLKDLELSKRLCERRKAIMSTIKLKDVLITTSKTAVLTATNKEILANANEKEIYELFKSETGDNLDKLISTCLIHEREKTTKVLRTIAAENILNSLRVEQYIRK